ncbi:MurR/RpiR family transcriptional regulator [Clostridium botulinum]|nr:MurR/RpiR family transcriptional regulator [Clostridium botulinum]NFR15989.1 MurR/RpiR family transcriptional regulator [Clostridium botulinum]NFR44725.1 MurR/RpiR family transcriptional regulator [Clostridium botulinum]NFS51581.1 MurR/RpiR family transcriptional regulator [Clostridium botulinum]
MKIYELINNNYDKLTQNDHEIFNYISNNQEQCKDMTCEQVANKCHVSRTTLLRFCRKLNLNSFAELKYLLKSSACKVYEDSSLDIEEACQTYHKTIDEIKGHEYKNICSLIYNAETIYIYGTGNAQKAEAEEFKRIFLSAGKCVVDLFDLGEVQLIQKKFTGKDLFVIISLSGETIEGIEILKSIESGKINTISITRFQNNAIARMCKDNLYVSTKMLHGFKNLSYEMTAAFYVLLDILFVYYLEYIREVKV